MPLWLGHLQAGQKDPACRLWSGRQYNRCCFNTQLGPACSAVCPADAEDKWSKAFSPEKSPVNGELISLTDISALSVEARLLRPSWDTPVEQRDGWMHPTHLWKGRGCKQEEDQGQHLLAPYCKGSPWEFGSGPRISLPERWQHINHSSDVVYDAAAYVLVFFTSAARRAAASCHHPLHSACTSS